MKKEIQQMHAYLKSTQNQIAKVLDKAPMIMEQLKDVKVGEHNQIYLIGSGASGEGARVSAYLFLELFNQNPIFVTPYQFVHYSHKALKANDIVIALSQTGTSALVLDALRLANASQAISIGLSATPKSPITQIAQYPLVFEEFIELVDYKVTGVLGLLYGLWLTALGLAQANGKISSSQVKTYLQKYKAVNAKYDEYAHLGSQWAAKNIESLDSSITLTALGSGPLVEVAAEIAIKSVEIQNRFAVYVDSEEYLHGFCAANPRDNITLLLVDKANYDYAKKLYEAIQTLDQKVIWFGYQAPEGDCGFEVDDDSAINVAYFLPVIHALLIEWAALKGYGEYGTSIFAYYQDKLKVREEDKEKVHEEN